MHHIYHTDAFVLGSRPFGEDSKTLFLYTRELGLVHARAQALRKISSKLRFALQDYSRASVDLVRGREVWRLTTAVPVDAHRELCRRIECERVLARVLALIQRLCSGEEPNAEIFSILEETYTILSVDLSPEEGKRIEIYLVAKILGALGYVDRASVPAVPEALTDEAYRKRLLEDINRALAASQL